MSGLEFRAIIAQADVSMRRLRSRRLVGVRPAAAGYFFFVFAAVLRVTVLMAVAVFGPLGVSASFAGSV
jgi:hypothetical protein